MPMLAFCYPVLAISLISCLWLAYRRAEVRRRERALRDRVTFLLWTMARLEASPGRGTPMAAHHRKPDETRHTDNGGWEEHSRHGALGQAGAPSCSRMATRWPDSSERQRPQNSSPSHRSLET